MIASDIGSGVEQLGEMIAGASVIVPFTGAGISTECGIPDFRSPGGLWSRNRPIPFDEFIASREARDESWRRRFAIDATFKAAAPGRGHRAVRSTASADEQRGRRTIDGGDFSKAQKPLALKNNATATAVKIRI